ncbi:dnaJ homolog subfamily C member 12 [Latimeria chalumnae]|uniref:DnaJ homolog subfamily C member 12 n=1 Tax=Latimeria chalumnae TaxID=7897 RepID=H3AG08_LATCH|nr:PREDICTED: dnaJ homolog subfamily C member 12 [Latimeria chalumnae]|eukprot:XP_006010358.1 PREDICTED: dnaJ homolog subfamily C member 12 [Latimeria chalumnae]
MRLQLLSVTYFELEGRFLWGQLQISMDAILNCNPEDLEDYYTVLGCDELSTTEQILTEFKSRALECHPDKHPENPKAVEEFQKLQQAKETLANEESRTRYDYWRRSKITIPFQQWEALSDSVKMSMHWAVRTKKEPMLEPLNTDSAVSTGYKIESQAQEETKKQEAEEPQSPKSPDSPRIYDASYWHLRFRWSADTPSELLRKFRNYEI